jgi:hypothetical protein
VPRQNPARLQPAESFKRPAEFFGRRRPGVYATNLANGGRYDLVRPQKAHDRE